MSTDAPLATRPASRPAPGATAPDRIGLGIGLCIASMAIFACMDAISKLLSQGYAITQILWIRYAIFTLFALALARSAGIAATWRSARPGLQLGRALLLVAENGIFVLAFKYLPLADVHAVAAASPLIVVALSVPILGEKVGVRRWLAVLIGLCGVLLIVRPGLKAIDGPMLLMLLCATLWGLYQIMVRLCARSDSSLTTLLWSAVIGLAATSLVGPLEWRTPDAQAWGLLIVLALLGSLGHYALIKALEHAPASTIQPYTYTLLMWVSVLGLVVFGDVPDGWTVAGALVIIASGLYAWHRERVRARQAAASVPVPTFACPSRDGASKCRNQEEH